MGKTLETLLRLILDQAAFNKTKASVKGLDADVEKLGEHAKAAGDAFDDFMGGVDKGAQVGIERLKQLASRVDELKRKEKEAAAASQKRTLTKTGSSVASVGRFASAAGVGGVGEALTVGGEATKILPGVLSAMAALGPASIAVVAGLGAMAAIFYKINKDGQAAAKAMRQVIDRQKEYYQLVLDGTTESVQDAINAAEKERDLAQKRLDDLQWLEDTYKDQAKSLGIFNGAIYELGGIVDNATDAVKDGHEAYKTAKEEIEAANQKIEDYNALIRDGVVAANDAAEAEKKLADARRSDVQKQIEHQIELERLRTEGTSKELLQRLVDIDRERRAIQDHMAALENLAEENEDGAALLQEYTDRLAELNAQEKEINANIRPVVEAREEESSKIKAGARTLDESIKAREAEQQAIEDQKQALADATQDYLDDSTQLIQDGYEKRADIEKSYQDELVKIAESAADDAEKALADIQEDFANLARDLGRDLSSLEGDAQLERMQTLVDSQREEARSAREHARNLQKIREDAQAQETDLLLNRDFRGLFQLRQQTTQRLREEENNYQDQQNERRIALAQELQDQVDNYVREREQRIQKYQQDQKDAYDNYVKERVQARQEYVAKQQEAWQSHQRELTELRQTLTQSLLLRRQAWIQELQLQSQTAEQQVQLEQQKQQALLTVAQQALAQVNGMSGGSTGYGMFGLSGAVNNSNSNQNSMAFSQTNNISGAGNNPQALANLIQQQTLNLLKGLFT